MGREAIDDYTKIAMLVLLDEIVKHDKSILALADMPIGYKATRGKKSGKWLIEKIDSSDSEIGR